MSLRWALVLLLVALSLTGCQDDRPAKTLQATLPVPSTVEDALYPRSEPLLMKLKGVAYLPSFTAAVMAVASPDALIAAAGLAEAFEDGEEPFDRTLEALALWGTGLRMHSAADLAAAGLDGSEPWGVAWLYADGPRVVFGPVSDAAKLRARLELAADRSKRELLVEEVDGATIYRTQRFSRRVAVVRDGLAFFLHADGSGHDAAGEAAKLIAATDAEAGLAAKESYAWTLGKLSFGAHANVLFQPSAYIDRELDLLKRERDAVKNNYANIQRQIEFLSSRADPNDSQEVSLDDYRERRKYEDVDLAGLDAREAALKKLAYAVPAVAIGIEIGATTVRAKMFAGRRGDGLAHLLAARSDKPLWPVKRGPAPRVAFDGALDKQMLRALAVGLVGAEQARAAEHALHDASLGFEQVILPRLTGDVALLSRAAAGAKTLPARFESPRQRADSGDEADAESGDVLVLGLKDGAEAGKFFRSWLASEAGDKAVDDGAIEGSEDHLRYRVNGGPMPELWFSFVEDRLLVATSETPLKGDAQQSERAEQRSWVADSADPLVAMLGTAKGADAFVAFDATFASERLDFRRFMERNNRFSLHAFERHSFDVRRFGIRPRRSISILELEEIPLAEELSTVSPHHMPAQQQEPTGDLSKKRNELRAELRKLRSRHATALATGADRLMTALGGSVISARVTDDGVALYGAQRLGEDNTGALAEWVIWQLVESAGASDTVKQIAKTKQEIAKLNKRFRASLGF